MSKYKQIDRLVDECMSLSCDLRYAPQMLSFSFLYAVGVMSFAFSYGIRHEPDKVKQPSLVK